MHIPRFPHRLAAVSLFAVVAANRSQVPHSVLLVPMPAEAAWQDLAFLAAVPAACAANGGTPLVLAVDPARGLPAEAADFLERCRPQHLVWLGGDASGAAASDAAPEHLPAASADAAACALARRYFPRSDLVVLCAEADYAQALVASVLAARSSAPLLFCGRTGPSAETAAVLAAMDAKKLLVVGDVAGLGAATTGRARIERLRDPVAVARHLQGRAAPLEYLVAAAPADRRHGHVRKLSLAGAALAAGRRGALVPLGDAAAPPPDAAAAQAALRRFRTDIGSRPEVLCLVGMPEAIPMATVAANEGIDPETPSDLGYADADDDPFLELDVGRLVAEDTAAGTLLAARSLAYPGLVAADLVGRCALAEWERQSAPVLTDAGFAAPTLHTGDRPFAADSPLASATVLVHNAHSSWAQLGATYVHDSNVLLAPCLVESGGCGPAALDQDPEHRSVALRLLRNGAIAFVGNVRRTVAQHELYRTEFWHGALTGSSLGRAHRDARNRVLVAAMAHGQVELGLFRFQLHNTVLYGDPALVLHRPRATPSTPAKVTVRGTEVTVHPPATWWRTEVFVPTDWNYAASPVLYGWRGAGVGVETSWDPEARRSLDRHVFTAELRTRRRVRGLEALDSAPAPLGWDGLHFVDEHADGSRSVFFRVRLFEGDPATGEVRQRAPALRFRLR